MTGTDPAALDFTVSFQKGPIVFAVEATIELTRAESVEGVTFTIHSKPGAQAPDIQVTYANAYLQRTAAIDEALGVMRVPVFGLYRDYDNEVEIEVAFTSQASISHAFTINTLNDPPQEIPDAISVTAAAPDLDMGFLFIQRFGGPVIVDVDGEIRWSSPTLSGVVFPCAFVQGGIVLGTLDSNTIIQVDWLGRPYYDILSDSRCVSSHHNIEPGKTGLFNTVTYVDEVLGLDRPESVLAEMTETGVVTRLWDFDQIFNDHIAAYGEDPLPLVQNGVDWFHMNSAVYDASDDSIIMSSRENFIVKADYETGAIKWILGSPGKLWYTAFPLSLQPLALTVTGDAPIGQHALSVSADGTLLTCFNNGLGNTVLPDVGDSRTASKVSVYRIDAAAGTAVEVLALDGGSGIYSRICSSVYPTGAGDLIVTFSDPSDASPPRILVVDGADQVLFDADVLGDGCASSYATREIDLRAMRIE